MLEIGAGMVPPVDDVDAEAMRGAGAAGEPTLPMLIGAGAGVGPGFGEAGALAKGLGMLKGIFDTALGAGDGDGVGDGAA